MLGLLSRRVDSGALARGFCVAELPRLLRLKAAFGALIAFARCALETRGTNLKTRLVRANDAIAVRANASAEQPASADKAGAFVRRALRILLVDDEDLVREVLAEALTDHGYEVMQAEGGATALALLGDGEQVDCLVSDLSMPGIDGLAVIREARARGLRCPAILLTGYIGETAELPEAETPGAAFRLLRKPMSGGRLAEHIASLLDLSPDPAEREGKEVGRAAALSARSV